MRSFDENVGGGTDIVPRQQNTPAMAQASGLEKARIEAAYTMALMRPRNIEDARQRVLDTCSRPGFANDKSALYVKPVGGRNTAEGAGIRLAEELMRSLGNMKAEVRPLYEDAEIQQFQVEVLDLETNISFSEVVTVRKTVERKFKRDGQEVVGQRDNSKGETIFIVKATEDDLLTKRQSFISKSTRNCILRCTPNDIVQDALAQIRATRMLGTKAEDPKMVKRRMLDGFGAIGVLPSTVETYCMAVFKRTVDQLRDEDIGQLRAIYQTIQSGESSWESYMDNLDLDADAPEQPTMASLRKSNAKPDEKPQVLKQADDGAETVADEFGLLKRDRLGIKALARHYGASSREELLTALQGVPESTWGKVKGVGAKTAQVVSQALGEGVSAIETDVVQEEAQVVENADHGLAADVKDGDMDRLPSDPAFQNVVSVVYDDGTVSKLYSHKIDELRMICPMHGVSSDTFIVEPACTCMERAAEEA